MRQRHYRGKAVLSEGKHFSLGVREVEELIVELYFLHVFLAGAVQHELHVEQSVLCE